MSGLRMRMAIQSVSSAIAWGTYNVIVSLLDPSLKNAHWMRLSQKTDIDILNIVDISLINKQYFYRDLKKENNHEVTQFLP